MFEKIHFKSIKSTNQYLKENYKILNDKTVITCNEQTEGKGQFNRIWFSEIDKDILFSVLVKDKLILKNISVFPMLIPLLLLKTIKNLIKEVTIKWPNDILINNKKVAGILIENIYTVGLEACIIGIGINVRKKEFPVELFGKATSLEVECNKNIDLNGLLNDIINLIEKEIFINKLNRKKIFVKYEKILNLAGKKVKYNLEVFDVIQLNPDGSLLISNGEINKTITSSENLIFI